MPSYTKLHRGSLDSVNGKLLPIDKSGLAGYWPYWENQGTTLYGEVNGNDGNFVNAPTWQWDTTLNKPVLSLNGANNDRVEVPSSPSTNITGDITWCVWIYDAGQSGGWSGIASKSSTSSFTSGYLLSGDGSGGSTEGLMTGYNGTTYNSGWDFSQNQWLHLVVIHDDSATQDTLYVNGVQQATWSTESLTSTNTDTLRLGANTNTDTDTWNGKMAQVLIYDRVLSAGEVANIYEKTRP